ncbi:glycosyltransferase family 4 protein [Roseivirga sp. E12]|uniref:glycosyltransferase family 4 protein n=1 Tax=Roseivirga sp. E12 TaxID=2819237 RepID=UPI001ABCEEBA|nr:MraY family glycosyltransferase [Roseivirga sp. E12]MBO3699741.1 undecaprenyl/decaprenyl-phosphate alpha-N-acetylglucosaminyl 1-phosphate transferase [Roseivirga sp. E12]
MEQIFLVGGTAFLVTFLMFPVFIKFFKRRNFLDDPGGRKIHTAKTPAMGGLPIFIGFCIAILIWAPFDTLREIKYVLSALSIMFIIGFRDDLINLRAFQKLFGQIAASLIIVTVCDIRLMSLYGLFGIEEIPIALSYLISVFTIIVITNAYNLIDGIDGLAGSVGVITSLFLGTWFFLNGQSSFALISFAFAGGLLAFLNFNWAPSKIFMGDTGSLLIGFFLSIVTIKFIDSNSSLQHSEFSFGGSIGTAIAVLILPLADTARVFVKRVAKGKSPMHPDRTHFHHILLRLGCNHAQSTGILVTVNIVFVLLALVLKNFSDAIVIPAILVTVFALGTILELIFKSAIDKRKEELKERNRAKRNEAKVVSISKNAG